MSIGAVLMVAVVGLLIPIPITSHWTYAIGDLSHAPFFGLVALIVHRLLDRYRPLPADSFSQRVMRTVRVSVGLFLFGAVMEGAQTMMGRQAAVHDAVANGLGILAAACWYWATHIKRCQPHARWVPRGFLLAGVCFLAIACWRPAMMLCESANSSLHSWRQTDVAVLHTGMIALQRGFVSKSPSL
jgi:hypothetical protein